LSLTAKAALRRLRDGNRHYKAEIRQYIAEHDQTFSARMAAGQAPFAVVLACSDSRVPVEAIFGQGAGDLFVIRVAGNIVAPTQLASVEFAVQKLGSQLIVVMGHTHCGAVQATLEAMAAGEGLDGPLVSRIRPALEGLPGYRPGRGDERQMKQAVRANVATSVAALKDGLGKTDGLQVIGAEYDLETGAVVFL
jgi:carbonic anhydrase